jgi:hypothetical protein
MSSGNGSIQKNASAKKELSPSSHKSFALFILFVPPGHPAYSMVLPTLRAGTSLSIC